MDTESCLPSLQLSLEKYGSTWFHLFSCPRLCVQSMRWERDASKEDLCRRCNLRRSTFWFVTKTYLFLKLEARPAAQWKTPFDGVGHMLRNSRNYSWSGSFFFFWVGLCVSAALFCIRHINKPLSRQTESLFNESNGLGAYANVGLDRYIQRSCTHHDAHPSDVMEYCPKRRCKPLTGIYL